MYFAISVSYGDVGTDVAVGLQLIRSGHRAQGLVTFGILSGALVVQALVTFLFREGPIATLVALVGGKPLYEMYQMHHL